MAADAARSGYRGPRRGLPADGEPDVYDLAIVGGGPAGTHAALKAVLLYKTAVLFDKGHRTSRIYFAPKVDNLPGRPEGVSGREIVEGGFDTLEEAQQRLGHRFVRIHAKTEVVEAHRETDVREGEKNPLFVLRYSNSESDDAERPEVRARNVIIATGSVDRQPITREYRQRDIETILPYANKGLADFCLLCDGHAVEDQRVAVIGCGRSAAGVAASLKKNFGADTVLVTCGGLHPEFPADKTGLGDDERGFLAKRDIPVIEKTVKGWYGLKKGILGIEFEDGSKEEFDRGWVSMGWYAINSELAVALGAATDDEGAVVTDRNCEAQDSEGNRIKGLFAIGDVRADSWNQIPIAWGEAETAVIHAFAHHL